MARRGHDDGMDVVGHHAPGEEMIPLTVEVLHRASNDLSNAGVFEPTRARAVVQEAVDLFGEEEREAVKFFFGQRTRLRRCCLDDRRSLRAPSAEYGFRK